MNFETDFETIKKNPSVEIKRQAIEAYIESNPNSPVSLLSVGFPLEENESVNIIWKFLSLYGGIKDFRLPTPESLWVKHRKQILFEQLLISDNKRASRRILRDTVKSCV